MEDVHVIQSTEFDSDSDSSSIPDPQPAPEIFKKVSPATLMRQLEEQKNREERRKGKKKEKKESAARFKRNVIITLCLALPFVLAFFYPERAYTIVEYGYNSISNISWSSSVPEKKEVRPFLPLYTANLMIPRRSVATPFTPNEILSKTPLRGLEYDVNFLVAAMTSHIKEYGFSGICAVHVGVPMSLCLVVLEDGLTIQEMFNAEVMLWSEDDMIPSEESSVYCGKDKRFSVNRHNHIKVRALDKHGKYVFLEYIGEISARVEALLELNKGMLPCD